ncbi:MAG TPA: iron-sulfur cluster repair di-iron protein [Ohtaekwangia sp.]
MITLDEQLDMASVTVADIALTFPYSLEILNRYNLDYCCSGKKNFVDACDKAGLPVEKIWREILLSKSNVSGDNRVRFDTWEVPLLIDFIIQHHHRYVRESIPQIQELLDKVCSVHGEDSPVLYLIRSDFSELAEELLQHLPKEEQVLFPAIRRIFDRNSPSCYISPIPEHLGGPIAVMEHEHDRAGQLIKSIRKSSENYTPPAYACPTFQLTYKMLREFETDLLQHIHLENNILFAKVK